MAVSTAKPPSSSGGPRRGCQQAGAYRSDPGLIDPIDLEAKPQIAIALHSESKGPGLSFLLPREAGAAIAFL
jgi:hypothetical protein